MGKKCRRFIALGSVTTLAALSAAPAAMAGGTPPPPTPPPPDGVKIHCNDGRGNGSEGCDAGKSGTAGGATGQNMGGDEGGPIAGGTGTP